MITLALQHREPRVSFMYLWKFLALLLPAFFTSSLAFGKMFFEYRHQVKDFHLFVFTRIGGSDGRSSSVHL